MTLLCGIDLGTFRTLTYIAWLQNRHFMLDLYTPSIENPLPPSPFENEQPAYIGIDGPQGLPAIGRARRMADEQANTPTRKLPNSRDELQQWMLYRGLIEAGVEMFWAIHSRNLASIAGLEPNATTTTTVFETYPRFVIKRLWPGIRISSKTKTPLAYIDLICDRIQADGYTCASVIRPTVDQVDAMLGALAAEGLLKRGGNLEGAVGIPPMIDIEGTVVREGYIIGP